MRALNVLLASGAAVLAFAAGPGSARAGSVNPEVLVGQVDAAKPPARSELRVQDVAPAPGAKGLAVAPLPAGGPSGPSIRVAQPQAALDQCEAILQGRAPPVDGLDCSAGQLDQLRQQVQAEADAQPSSSVDVDTLSQDLGSPSGSPEATDPSTGAPAVVILTPGG